MRVYITLDYELFFGPRSGTLKHSILEPTEKLLDLASRYDAKFTFFIDAGQLVAMKRESVKYPNLIDELEQLRAQIKRIEVLGHSVQLHVHPHWEDAKYSPDGWLFDVSRFSLQAFSKAEVYSIIQKYKAALTSIVTAPIFAFRAGGWCIQPFDHLASALRENQIWLDSTVYRNGFYSSDTHRFDYRNCPSGGGWSFEDDVLQVDEAGFFYELPITSIRLTPFFFWRLAWNKKFHASKHKIFGDGVPIGAGKKDILRMLSVGAHNVASIDGSKSSYLEKVLRRQMQKNEPLVVIGHPKALSRYSLSKFEELLKKYSTTVRFASFAEFERDVAGKTRCELL